MSAPSSTKSSPSSRTCWAKVQERTSVMPAYATATALVEKNRTFVTHISRSSHRFSCRIWDWKISKLPLPLKMLRCLDFGMRLSLHDKPATGCRRRWRFRNRRHAATPSENSIGKPSSVGTSTRGRPKRRTASSSAPRACATSVTITASNGASISSKEATTGTPINLV